MMRFTYFVYEPYLNFIDCKFNQKILLTYDLVLQKIISLLYIRVYRLFKVCMCTLITLTLLKELHLWWFEFYINYLLKCL